MPAGGGSGRGGNGGAASGGAGSGGSGAAGSSGRAGASGASATGFPYELEFVGNITTGDGVDTDGKTYSRHWDQITPENAGKWGSVQANAGAAFNWRTLDAIYDYTEEAGIIFKEHAFVWGSQQPSGSLNESDVKEWMTEFCRRYPNTKLIDVVNEPPPHTRPSYAEAIGGGTDGSWQWIINSFIWAREACPNAILILNDYSNIEYQADADNFLDIVKVIQAAGAPVDALGAQSHDLDDQGMELETVQGFIERLHAETGLPLYITEMDIDQTDDEAQLRYYQDYFPYFRDSGYVKGITIWGWIYGRTWSVAPNSGLVRDGQSRPAMTWLMEQLDRPVP
jgi:endo-1,4-beta-xylanase